MNTLISLLFRIDCSRSKAFSLVESLIALLILSIAILAIAAVPIMSTKLAVLATHQEQAHFLAVKALDSLEADSSLAVVTSPDIVGGFSVIATKQNTIGRAVVSWRGVAGQSSLTLERRMSDFSSRTRKE